MCRDESIGIILDVQVVAPSQSPLDQIWAKVMWSTGKVTWEDMNESTFDDIFRQLS